MKIQTKDDFMDIGVFSSNMINYYLASAKAQKARYIIIVCDTFDYEDYAIFAQTIEQANAKANECNKEPMQKVMGIYDVQ